MQSGVVEALGMTMKAVEAFGRDNLWEEMSASRAIRRWKDHLYQSQNHSRE